ncbi:hypothetical protein OSI54_13855 [Mycobacterium ulcerans]
MADAVVMAVLVGAVASGEGPRVRPGVPTGLAGSPARTSTVPAAAVTWKRSGVPWWGSPTVIVRPSRMSTVANRAPSTNMPLRL